MYLSFSPDIDQEQNDANSGLESFRAHGMKAVIREICQNSVDAALVTNGRPGTVHVSFREHRLEWSDFDAFLRGASEERANVPSFVDVMREKIQLCREVPQIPEKSRAFLDRAEQCLERKMVRVLEVRDEGTTGCNGDPGLSPGTGFHSLLKGHTNHNNQNRSPGGAYGIGKNAPFVASALRTVFYSTRHPGIDGLMQGWIMGKTMMASHQAASGVYCKSVGWWGRNNSEPPVLPYGYVGSAEIQEEIAEGMRIRRGGTGTTLFIVGFEPGSDVVKEGQSPDWVHEMGLHAFKNFQQALSSGRLVVSLQAAGTNQPVRKLGQEMPEWLLSIGDEGSFAVSDADGDEIHDKLDSVLVATRLLHDIQTPLKEHLIEVPVRSSDPEYPELRLRMKVLLVTENLPEPSFRQFLFCRKGMLITDDIKETPRGGTRSPRMKGLSAFVARCWPDDLDTDRILRALEPPEHLSWSISEAEPHYRKGWKEAFEKLWLEIKDLVTIRFDPTTVERISLEGALGVDGASKRRSLEIIEGPAPRMHVGGLGNAPPARRKAGTGQAGRKGGRAGKLSPGDGLAPIPGVLCISLGERKRLLVLPEDSRALKVVLRSAVLRDGNDHPSTDRVEPVPVRIARLLSEVDGVRVEEGMLIVPEGLQDRQLKIELESDWAYGLNIAMVPLTRNGE